MAHRRSQIPLLEKAHCVGERGQEFRETPHPDFSDVVIVMNDHPQPTAQTAGSHLPTRVYATLRAIANKHLAAERANHTLQPTALVHEAFLRVSGRDAANRKDASSLLFAAAGAMRGILVDHARRRAAIKRGGDVRRSEMDVATAPEHASAVDLLALDESLTRLRALDAQLAQVVELRFFGGMSDAEIADALNCSTRSVRRAWSVARAWLARELRP
ncbi:MAG: ECF-type sigma factor [Planctomycetota bacterium]